MHDTRDNRWTKMEMECKINKLEANEIFSYKLPLSEVLLSVESSREPQFYNLRLVCLQTSCLEGGNERECGKSNASNT